MADVHHETVWFSGHVQGVGFRYMTLETAKGYEVCGYVSNLTDGRVQAEVEGDPKEIDSFIMALQERLHGHIRKIERRAKKRVAEFSGFTIR